MTKVLMMVVALFALGSRAYCAEGTTAKLEDPWWAITGLEDNEATTKWILEQCKTAYPENARVNETARSGFGAIM